MPGAGSSWSMPSQNLASGLFLVFLMVLLAVPVVQAGGTGQEVLTDSGTDGGGSADFELLRLGASADVDNIYFWVKVGEDDPTFDPSLSTNHAQQLRLPVDFVDVFQQQYYANAYYETTGAWTNHRLWRGNSFSGSFLFTAIPSPVWICNEAQFTVPRSAFNLRPVNGDVFTGMMVSAWTPGAIHDTMGGNAPLNQPPGTGTWTVGQNGAMYQDAPTALTASVVGDNQVAITLTPAADTGAQPVTHYRIYRSLDAAGPYVHVGSTSGASTTYIDRLPVQQGPPTTYHYKASSVNCDELPAYVRTPPTGEPAYTGGESFRSAAVSITPEFRPGTPSGLAASPVHPNNVTLSWDAPIDCPAASCTPSGSGASGIGGYELYRSTDSTVDVSDTLVCTCDATTLRKLDTGLDDEATYHYAVRAFDRFSGTDGPNFGPFSSVLTVKTPHLPVPPQATDQALTADEDSTMALTLQATDGRDAFGDLRFALTSSPGGITGTPPTLTFTPEPDLCTPDAPLELAFKVTDTDGLSDDGLVTLDVACIDDAPVANDDTLRARPTTEGAIALDVDQDGITDVLANDVDADAAYGDVLSVISAGTDGADGATANGGRIAIDDGILVYTPPTPVLPKDTFDYIITDGQSNARATVSLTLEGIVVPTCDTFTVPYQAVDAPLDVRANDPDGDVLTIVGVTAGRYTKDLTTDTDRVFYTPLPDFVGPDRFWYTVSDGTTEGTCKVDVWVGDDMTDPAPMYPVLYPVEPLRVLEGGQAKVGSIQVSMTDDATPLEDLKIRLLQQPMYGHFELDGQILGSGTQPYILQGEIASGLLVYVHDGGEARKDIAVFDLTDGDTVEPSFELPILIAPVNDLPWLSPDSVGIQVSVAETITITDQQIRIEDPDTPQGSRFAVLSALPPIGTLKLDGVALGLGGKFTQADIDAGRLTLEHAGGEGQYALGLHLFDRDPTDGAQPEAGPDDIDFDGVPNAQDPDMDGDGVPNASDACPAVPDPRQADLDQDGIGDACAGKVRVSVPVTVLRFNEPPEAGSGAVLALQQGRVGVLGAKHLPVLDPDGDDALLSFRLVSAPSQGRLERAGVPFGAGETFRMADLFAGAIVYRHGGSDLETDSMRFQVTDGGGKKVELGVLVQIAPVRNLGPIPENHEGASPVRQDPCRVADPQRPTSDCENPDPAAAPQPTEPEPRASEPQVKDLDRDRLSDLVDNCPSLPNPDQRDLDDDGRGDVCDTDADGDRVAQRDASGRLMDNCPMTYNPDQADADKDGVGDACDEGGPAVSFGAEPRGPSSPFLADGERPTHVEADSDVPVAAVVGGIVVMMLLVGLLVAWGLTRRR